MSIKRSATVEIKRENVIPRDEEHHRFSLILIKLKGQGGIWTIEYGNEGEAEAFLRGVQALASLVGLQVDIPPIPPDRT